MPVDEHRIRFLEQGFEETDGVPDLRALAELGTRGEERIHTERVLVLLEDFRPVDAVS